MTEEQFWTEIRRGLLIMLKAVEAKMQVAKNDSRR